MNALLDFLSTRRTQLAVDSWQHVSATVQAVLLATALSLLVGVAVYRSRAGSAVATGLASTALTVPSFALLGLLIPVLGLGVLPTMVALVIYAVLPILRNTIVGLDAVPAATVDAARGVGMSRMGVLGRVELPLAWPSILAGIRVSTQMSMGILAIAAYAKGPGLGNLIFAGLSRVGTPTAVPMALTATVLIVVLALVLDGLLVLLGRLTARGIQ
ncbi:ABC transporter permease [Dietzia sp. 179-F 9C3 NHS]|uniref:ABC transporter permease n=1 Tax=Dietzia sp. 179-F 9C3 NHS TaxID=3374295 RepID=UPI0038799FD8